jgi:lantibiotic modifying enzyme
MWAMDPKFPRLMPNFSHGTAGVAYFLATLARETARREFLDAALLGARYLQTVATTNGDICLVFHDEPDNRTLYYLGWCHGPAGTGRLFYRLFEATREASWLEWAHRSARAILASGIPERQTPGFWNNVSVCCGNAGVAEFMLGLGQATNRPEYVAFARRVTENLLQRATREGGGLRWIQAEHRTRPELLVAQTGYMQGAAGVGVWLLRLDAAEAGRRLALRLPDTPF